MRLLRFFAALAATSFGSLVTFAAAPSARPNVIVFLADDFGGMDLGCYNPQTFYETPHLDKFAAQGARFTQGYSANPVCSPTRYSIMTGKYPTRVGLTNFLPGARVEKFAPAPLTREMPLEEHTMAEALRGVGYRTAFVGKWHLGEDERFWPEAQGYETNIAGTNRGSPNSWFSPYKNVRLTDGPEGEFLTDRLAVDTIKLMRQFKERGEPFLINHCFYSVHTPLRAPEPLVEKYRAKAKRLGLEDAFIDEEQFMIAQQGPRKVRSVQGHAVYAAMVEAMDTAFGKMMAALEELGLADNTLVIFTSDNGGLSTSEGTPTSNLPLRAGKGWLYEGGIRTAHLLRWPGKIKPGTTSAVPIMSIDLYPTVLEAAGARPQPGQIVDGRSLVPLLTRGEPPAREALYWHYPHYGNQGNFPGGAIRVGDWKLVENYEDGTVRLFNLRDDVGERNDLAAAQPARAKELRAKLHAWYHELGAKFLEAKPGGPPPWRPY